MPLFGTKVGLNTAAVNAGTALADGDYISGVFKTYITEADLQAAAVSQNANRFKTGQIVYISGSNKLYILTSSFDDNAGETSIFSSSFSFPGAGSTDTGSLLLTASVAGNTMTFTKGNGDTFNVALPGGSGGGIFVQTGSYYATTNDLQVTGSLIASSITSSFQGNLIGTASLATTAISATSASYIIGGNVSGAVTSSISSSYIQSLNVYGPLGANSVVSASYALSASVEIIKEVSSSYADTASVALDAVESGTVSLNTLTFTKGNGSTFDLTVDTGSGGSGIFEQTGSYYATTNDLQVTGSIIATSITSSFSGSFTGNLTGTSSLATTAISASDLYINNVKKAEATNTGLTIIGGLTTNASSDMAGLNMTSDIAMGDNNIGGVGSISSKIDSSLLDGQINATSSLTVTAASKTANNRYYNQGSSNAYYFNGIESPYITFYPGKSYRIAYPSSHPVAFYLDANRVTQYTTGVTTPATNTVQIDVTENTPSILYYQCTAHPLMGNASYIQSAATTSFATTASYIQSSNVYGPLGANSVVSASYAISASVEIIKEVSSSYAETASVALDAVESGTVNLNTLTFTKGNGTTFDLIVNTGSAGSGAGFPFSGSAVITGSLVVSGSGAIPIQASGQSINIGTPSDTTYTDGFFDTFTSATSLANAIDEISEAFLDLAPAKAGVLTSQNLSNPSSVDGYLAAGLFADEWYVGYSAHQEVPIITSNSVTLSTPSTSTIFRAGKNSDLDAGTLEGGVTGSITYASTSPVLSIRALTAGTGTTDNINITSLAQYNTFWVKANAQIPHTITATNTGSYKYAVSADNGAGTTNTRQVFWVGTTAQNYPNQTITPGTVTSASVTYNFLSGIQYLKTATFTIPMTADNMFNPVYNLNNVTFISSYFSNLTTGTQGSDSPSFNDQLSISSTTRDLTSGTNSAQSTPTAQIRVIKPGKSNVTSNSFNLSHTPVNSYASAQSTATVEQFLDEDKRDTGFDQTAWTPSATLTNTNLQVQNGRLVAGNTGDYSGFTGAQYYYRTFTGYSAGVAAGDFDFDNSGGTVFSSISAWGSGGDLEMIIVRPEDVSAGVPSKIYDFGRAQANSVAATGVAVPGGTADVYGIKLGSVGGLAGTGDNGWSFGTNTTIGASGELVLLIKYSSASETKQLNQLSITT